MKQNYAACLAAVLVHEGGFVNHPKDPGGATMRGVTQAVYDAWRRRNGLATRSVAQIADAELQAIYRREYWDAVKGDDLPSGLDYAVFDFAVNSGPSRAIRFLQSALGVAVDGVIGPVTLRAAQEVHVLLVISRLLDARMDFLRNLSTWPTFGRGWTNRVNGVRSKALAMAMLPPPDLPDDLETEPSQTEQEKTMLTVVMPFLMPLIRHALTTLAGVLVTYGVLQAGQEQSFVTILLGVVTWALGQGLSIVNAAKK